MEYYFVDRSGAPETDVGTFRYVLLRMRVSNASKHVNFVLQMDNVDASIRINNSMTSGEWITLVIDMDKIAKITQNADGSYKIKHCRLYTGDLGADSVDIAYVAFCDDWNEVAPLAVNDKVTLVTHASNPGGKVNAADGSCAAHVPTETVSGGIYTYSCSSCGQTIATKTVSSDVNLFISPAALGSSYGFSSAIAEEEGLVYRRFTSSSSSGHIYVRNAAVLADTGKFLIVKMRLNNTSAFVMEAGAAALSGITQEPVLKKGEWQTAVIDLSGYANYALDKENENVQIRFTVYGAAGFTVDVAYVAIVDDKAEAITVIEEKEYDHYVSWKKTPTVVKADQANCDVCAVTETKTGNTYSYSDCPICGRSFADTTKTISEDVTKYYSASDLASMSKFNAVTALGADATGEAFARITSSSGSAMEYYIVDKSSNPTTDLGEAVRYVVFKVRMSDIKCEYNFSLWTKDDKGSGISLHVTMTKADEWVTIVADMDAMGKLEANAGGDYTLKQFFMYTSATGENTLDIACVAFCNSWEEIKNVSGDDEAMLMTVGNGMGKLVSTADGSEITK
ncbi:MAG: hypothetical protein J6L83_02890 [Clostridia bacterium]|nr:hypothetical protein [Clostridia bacterium]